MTCPKCGKSVLDPMCPHGKNKIELELSYSEKEYVYLALYGEIERLKGYLKQDPGYGERMKFRIAELESVIKRLK